VATHEQTYEFRPADGELAVIFQVLFASMYYDPSEVKFKLNLILVVEVDGT
jgi:hypothetical protein